MKALHVISPRRFILTQTVMPDLQTAGVNQTLIQPEMYEKYNDGTIKALVHVTDWQKHDNTDSPGNTR